MAGPPAGLRPRNCPGSGRAAAERLWGGRGHSVSLSSCLRAEVGAQSCGLGLSPWVMALTGNGNRARWCSAMCSPFDLKAWENPQLFSGECMYARRGAGQPGSGVALCPNPSHSPAPHKAKCPPGPAGLLSVTFLREVSCFVVAQCFFLKE